MATTFFMLAGEASGDTHAARLIHALKSKCPDARFIGMGGPKMAAAGMEVAKDLDGMQVVGFWEVIKKYGFFRDVFYKLLDRVKQERPDALICIDYPGFNLRFAKEVRKLGIPILYYIVPQVWAWKEKRAASMAKYVDRAFCVFEFEPPFFSRFGLKTHFVGHPLMDKDSDPRSPVEGTILKRDTQHPTVALLPGSRDGELFQHVEPLCRAVSLARKEQPDLRALLSIPKGSFGGHIPMAQGYFDDREIIPRVTGRTEHANVLVSTRAGEHEVVALDNVSHSSLLPSVADFSIVKSGTSTLEAGLSGNPLCVIYRGSPISYSIAHLLVNIPVFSLINIVLGRYAVPELLQSDVNPERLAQEISSGLTDSHYRDQQRAALAELPKKLGGAGASARAAQGMLDFLHGKN